MSEQLSAAPSPVVTIRDGAVATVRLNRPDAMNSLDLPTKEALLGALEDVASDRTIRAVVLTGSGRAFCAGQDLREHVAGLRADDTAARDTVEVHYNPVVTLVATMDKPVVAAVNGVAAGAGASLALAADFRIMVQGAGMNLAFATIALSCDTGLSWHLPRLVGLAKAKELLLLPRTVPADECLALGLVTRVVAAEELDEVVASMAHQLAAGPTLAYGALRRALLYSSAHAFEDSLRNEAQLMKHTMSTADHRAAVEAFLDKGKPVYEGR